MLRKRLIPEGLAAIAITATTTATAATITTAAAAATTATTVATAATGRTLLTGPGFIDRQGTALKFFSMELGNRRIGLGLGTHFDKGETA